MITTMDAAGSLVIREAGLDAGAPLDVRCRDGVVEIEARPVELSIEKRGRLLVAVRRARLPALTTNVVERSRRRIRRGR